MGKTKRQLCVRLGEHVKSINLNEDNPTGQHFAKCHNGHPEVLRVIGFFALNLWTWRGDVDMVLLRKEKAWIFRMGCIISKGLNNNLSLKVFLE